jgi:SAM-dependent methyltransferase
MRNLDEHTADGFNRIWAQHGRPNAASASENPHEAFETYFSIFPLERFAGAEGFDLGCGNGRIARSVAPRAGLLHCIDPSPAGLAAVREALRERDNVRFHQAAVDAIPLPDASQDFGYSIGVLHHVPQPEAGLRACVAKLKRGAPFLLYVYYSLDNRPRWFRQVWRLSDLVRRRVSRLPFSMRSGVSTVLAASLYWPLSRTARLLERAGLPFEHVPLSFYRDHRWAELRADSLDRFGTAVEHRFSRADIEAMMLRCGLERVIFAEGPPYWIALGYKA